MSTQHISKSNFNFVPEINLNKLYSDDELYKTFNLSPEEVEYIDLIIKPLKDVDANDND